MSDISIEEFNRLKPKEIREYFGLYPVTRIIKYILDGTSNHRTDAIRTISYWLKYLKVRTDEEEIILLSYAIPFLIERFPAEKKEIRAAIAAALHFLIKTDAILEEHFINDINKFINKEEDQNIKRKLKQVLSWNEGNIRHSTWREQKKLHVSPQKFEVLEIIGDLEVYKIPLEFKPRPRKKVNGDNIQCVYFLQEKDNGYVKIGKTKNLKTKSFFPYLMPFRWEIIYTIESNNVDVLEKYFHRIFRARRINGEWFKLDEQDIEEIKLFDQKSINTVI